MAVDYFHELRADFDRKRIPADGQRYMFVGPDTWSRFLKIPEFVSSEFLQPAQMPYSQEGMQGKQFQTFTVILEPGVLRAGSVERNMVWYHDCMGWGVTRNPWTAISEHNERSAWLTVTRMQVGAKAVDPTGIYEFPVDSAQGTISRHYGDADPV
jgi:hypothetical protein